MQVTPNASAYNAMHANPVQPGENGNCYVRKNPPEVQVTNGQNLHTEFIYTVLQTSMQLVYIFSKEIISIYTKCGKQIVKFILNTLKYW